MRMPTRRRLLQLPWLLFLPTSAWARADTPLVVLQPLGGASPVAELLAVAGALSAFYAIRIESREPLPLPQGAFYRQRRRYRAETLLDYLVQQANPDASVTLGLTSVDISTTKTPYEDWGILGLSTLDGRSAVLSSFRCRRAAKSPAHVRARLAKTAVHELGHSFGLEHCPTPGCIMHDGEGSVLTTDSEHDLCDATRDRLRSAGLLKEDAKTPFSS
jgi:archaemetzincin